MSIAQGSPHASGAGDSARPGSFRLPHLAHARVEDAMHPGVISVPPETPLRDLARMLATRHIHCIVVAGPKAGALDDWGLISALDLVRVAMSGEGIPFEDRTAGEVAVRNPPTVSSAEQLELAAQLMAEHGAEHLIVVGAEHGRPVGLLSTLDICGVMAWGEA
ncbi:MAG TPA: CBS domain-containing protein [Solirubrobacteraceae bacterium]|nr:CBS domain-containing protein [Solirubrobacteraceae bacterium]